MTWHLPKDVECSSAGGHPIHDCEGGDGANWAPGGCDTHRPCEPTFMVVATASGAPPMLVRLEGQCVRESVDSAAPDRPQLRWVAG